MEYSAREAYRRRTENWTQRTLVCCHPASIIIYNQEIIRSLCMRLIIFGPPGVGKGTQADLLRKRYSIPHISTGDILRKAVDEGTGLGKRAREYMDLGRLVPDDVMIGLIRDVLGRCECEQGFVLDGFPRTVAQAEALDIVFRELNLGVNAVISIEIDEDEIITRLSQRWMCNLCNQIFNQTADGIDPEAPCPRCSGTLYQRDDDKPEIVRHRLKVYNDSTQPVRGYYEKAGLLKHVDGRGDVYTVLERIIRELENGSIGERGSVK